MTVLLGSRDIQRGEEAVKQISLPNVKTIQLEITDDKSVDAALELVKKEYGGLDILVNNAGIVRYSVDANGDEAGTDETLNVNYYRTINMVNKFLPIINKNGRSVKQFSKADNRKINRHRFE